MDYGQRILRSKLAPQWSRRDMKGISNTCSKVDPGYHGHLLEQRTLRSALPFPRDMGAI